MHVLSPQRRSPPACTTRPRARGPSPYAARSPPPQAPGSDIPAAYVGASNTAYQSLNGTSMAAPHVSGVAAQLLALDPTLHIGEVKSMILDSAEENSIALSVGATAADTPNRFLIGGAGIRGVQLRVVGATLSSTLFPYTASQCVDGYLYTPKHDAVGAAAPGHTYLKTFCSSQEESNPTLTLDLGAVNMIHYVVVHNRQDCCQDRLAPEYQVSIWEQPPDFHGAYEVCSPKTGLPSIYTKPLLSPCRGNYSARYVQIKLPGVDRMLNLAEVEVFAQPHNCLVGITDYRGAESTTGTGITCQAWTSQSPHSHSRTWANYPNSGLGKHNFCRNPDLDSGGPWCYTANSSVRWGYCDQIPMCSRPPSPPPPPPPSPPPPSPSPMAPQVESLSCSYCSGHEDQDSGH